MYAGITLVPWIILFGVTGVLFNHPNFLSSRDVIKQISSDDIKNIMDLNIINIKDTLWRLDFIFRVYCHFLDTKCDLILTRK